MRRIASWEKCDPDEMSQMSRAAIFYALKDAKQTILMLNQALLDLWRRAEIEMPNDPVTEKVENILKELM